MTDTPGKVPDEDSVEEPTEYNRIDPTDGLQDPMAHVEEEGDNS